MLAQPPPDRDEGKRLDLRQLPVYTIDPHDAYEIDDGLSIQTDEDGDTWVYVHVADPTRYCAPPTEQLSTLRHAQNKPLTAESVDS